MSVICLCRTTPFGAHTLRMKMNIEWDFPVLQERLQPHSLTFQNINIKGEAKVNKQLIILTLPDDFVKEIENTNINDAIVNSFTGEELGRHCESRNSLVEEGTRESCIYSVALSSKENNYGSGENYEEFSRNKNPETDKKAIKLSARQLYNIVGNLASQVSSAQLIFTWIPQWVPHVCITCQVRCINHL